MRFPLLARTWDFLVGSKTHRTAVRRRGAGLSVLPLEDRITPTGRPLPLPYIFVGAGSGTPPLVRAYHADTGELAFEKQPFDAGFSGGVRVAAGDINHDGTPDLIAAAGPGGGPAVKVYDGKSGDLIDGPLGSFYAYSPTFTGGVAVASGDVDGDGTADVITAAGAGGGPNVKVFSGRTGAVIASFYAFAPGFRGGSTIAAADFTGDGKAELVVGAGAGGGPNVRVFDLSTGLTVPPPLGSFYAFDPSFTGGVSVASDALAGDVNGDGHPDIVVGQGAGGSQVRVFDGVDGSPVMALTPFGGGMTAGVTLGTAYVDDDAFADVIVGTGAGVTAQVKVFSGADGSELASPMSPYTPFGSTFTGGLFVAGSNDPSVVSIAVDQNASETDPTGAGRGRFAITRVGSGAITVAFVISSSSTATHDTDYTGVAPTGVTFGSVNFGSSDTVQYVDVVPVDDDAVEGEETVTVGLLLGEYTVGESSGATLTIADNDSGGGGSGGSGGSGGPTVSITGDRSASETDPTGAGTGWFTIHRSDGTGTLTVAYDAPTGTAGGGVDYTTPSSSGGSVTFAPGQTDATLYVVPVDDATVEDTETVTVTLPSPSGGYAVSGGTATLDLTDNDGSDPAVSITTRRDASEDGTTGWFVIHRDVPGDALTVSYAVTGGTATQGTDYTVPSGGTVTIPSGGTDIDLYVTPVDDALSEGPETVAVTLATVSGGGYQVAVPTATLTILDNDGVIPSGGTSPPDSTEPAPNTDQLCDATQGVLETDGAGLGGNVAKTAGGVLANGAVRLTVASVDGDTAGLALTVSWSNATGVADGLAGYGTQFGDLTRVVAALDGSGDVVVAQSASTSLRFAATASSGGSGGGSTYSALFGSATSFSDNSSTHEFTVVGGDGSVQVYHDFDSSVAAELRGLLKSRTDAAGNTTTVTGWDSAGHPTGIAATDALTGAAERVTLSYSSGGMMESAVRERAASGGSWTTIRRTDFVTANEANAPLALVGTVEKDGAGAILGETYNRYYAAGATGGVAGALKFHLGEAAVARAKAAFPSSSLDSLNDDQIAPYADNHYEYDSDGRATDVVTAGAGCSACNGGQGTATVQYATRAAGSYGVNEWKTRTTETTEDGTITRTYANSTGQTLLTAVSEPGGTGNTWVTYTKFGADGQVVLQAAPSAVNGYDEYLADLVGWSGSSATYLNSSTGLISTYTYVTSTTAGSSTAGDVAGFLKDVAIQQGTGGTAVPQSETLYVSRTAGGVTTYHVASSTQYRNDDGTGAQTTTYAYTWFSGTQQMESVTTTLPTVTTAENGPNAAATMTTVYDATGRAIWSKDAAGVLSYTAYDDLTGVVVKSIQDVDTTQTGDFADLPSGWSTPGGAGQHLISTSEVDELGRTTKSVSPLGVVSYTVYDDVNRAVRTYAGWDSTNHVPTGPTSVSRTDLAGGYTEYLTMSATPALDGGNLPTGAEAISNIQSLSRSYVNKAGQNTHSDSYFDLTGVTYSTKADIGTLNTNYYRTESAYDKNGRPSKSVSAAGTITRTEYDALGRVVSTWVGTDDTPATGFWSTTNLTGTNMVKVSEVEYDGGGVGDGNVTEQTVYPGGGAAARVSQTFFDWRNRAVASKSGVEVSESTDVNRPISYTEYDNLGQAVVSEMYDGDAVTVTSTAGVPNRPSSSLLRAKTVSSYDELGRAYKTETYSVDPSTGTVSTDALTSQVWFDIRGLTLKTTSPGGLVQKTAYDSLGRATTTYVTDGGGDSGWGDADDVTGDTVLSQSEMTYDADGNVLLSVSRERMHDASGTGALGTPSTGITARVSYSAAYYDGGNRLTDSVDVGTNGGTAWTRPGSVPGRSDTVLVNSVEYDAAGRAWKTTDPKGIESRTYFDLMGRTTKTIQNYVDGTVSDADDKTVEYEYGPAGMTKLKAKLTGGGEQVTEYVYGVSQGTGSGLDSNDIAGATKWPDPTTGASSSSQQETTTVNALGQTVTATDRNGTVHTLGYDALGRMVSDAVTTLGGGVDGTVRRVETAYDSQGNAYLTTTYDSARGGSIVTRTQRAFDGLGNLTREWQSHSGAVNTSTTPSVQYGYSALDSSNRVRLTSITYPSGYVLTYNYSSGLNGDISRLSSLSDAGGTVESYDYLGLGTVVRRSHPQPGVDLTYIGSGTGDAGDQYVGLDRFGRVVDQKSVKSGLSIDEFQYTYDRNGNRLTKGNAVTTGFDEAYGYDSLNQLTNFTRGGTTRSQSFDYDAVGNRDGVTTNGTTQSYTANKQNEITGISGATTPTYDANGNMTGDETGKTLVYNAWNKLVAVKSGSTTLVSYQYDGMNRRIVENSGTARDLYYSDQWQVLEESVGGSTTTRYVWSPVYVDAMILRDRDTDANGTLDERLYVVQDANFNVTAIVSAAGVVLERYAYDAYGAVTVLDASWAVQSGGSNYGWVYLHQGARRDGVSGLDYHRERDYSPSQGRWTSMDPMGYKAGDVNLFRYSQNGPVNQLDPAGLQPTGRDKRPTTYPVTLPNGVVLNADVANSSETLILITDDTTDADYAAWKKQLPNAIIATEIRNLDHAIGILRWVTSHKSYDSTVKIKTLIISGHARAAGCGVSVSYFSWSLFEGGTYEKKNPVHITYKTIIGAKAKAVRDLLAPDAVVVIASCGSGKDMNKLQILADNLQRQVRASTGDCSSGYNTTGRYIQANPQPRLYMLNYYRSPAWSGKTAK